VNLNLDFLFEEVTKDVSEPNKNTDIEIKVNKGVKALEEYAPKILNTLYRDAYRVVVDKIKREKGAKPKSEQIPTARPEKSPEKKPASAEQSREKATPSSETKEKALRDNIELYSGYLLAESDLDENILVKIIYRRLSGDALQAKKDLEDLIDRFGPDEIRTFLDEIKEDLSKYFKGLPVTERNAAFSDMLFGEALKYYKILKKIFVTYYLAGVRADRANEIKRTEVMLDKIFVDLILDQKVTIIGAGHEDIVKNLKSEIYVLMGVATKGAGWHVRSDIGKFDINIITKEYFSEFFSRVEGNATSTTFPDLAIDTRGKWIEQKTIKVDGKDYIIKNPLRGTGAVSGTNKIIVRLPKKNKNPETYVEVKSGRRRSPKRAFNKFLEEFNIKSDFSSVPTSKEDKQKVSQHLQADRNAKLADYATKYGKNSVKYKQLKILLDREFKRQMKGSSIRNYSNKTYKIKKRSGDFSQKAIWNAMKEAKTLRKRKFLEFFRYLHPMNISGKDSKNRIYYLIATTGGFILKSFRHDFLSKGRLILKGGIIYYGENPNNTWLKLVRDRDAVSLEFTTNSEEFLLDKVGPDVAISNEEIRAYNKYLTQKGRPVEDTKKNLKVLSTQKKKNRGGKKKITKIDKTQKKQAPWGGIKPVPYEDLPDTIKHSTEN
jgi:hypothetical protein